MSTLSQHVDDFLRELMQRLGDASTEPPLVRAEIARLKSDWPDFGRQIKAATPLRLPACDYLDDALTSGKSGLESGLASAIADLSPALHWTYSYPPSPHRHDLSARIAFCQIVGNRGLLASDRVHIGLTLLAPDTAYPPHAHPATEVYLVIAGTALWQAGADIVAPRLPGSIVLHPSSVPHAMTTKSEPLLAIWTWRGDLISPSVYSDTYHDSPALNPFLS